MSRILSKVHLVKRSQANGRGEGCPLAGSFTEARMSGQVVPERPAGLTGGRAQANPISALQDAASQPISAGSR